VHSALIQTVEESTSAQAWLKSAQLLLCSPERTVYNLVVGISDPITLSQADRRIVEAVDAFLTDHDCLPIVTVMNTIFPGGFYKQGGAEAVFGDFPKAYAFSREKWGTYAGRMFSPIGGKAGDRSRIQVIIDKLKANGPKMRAAYEVDVLDSSHDEDLSLYCAETDSRMHRGQPCLAHISFKLHDGDTLSLTAFYRSQYYVTKGLGNFLGLGQLLLFVSNEAGLKPGALIVHASMASIDPELKAEEVETMVKAAGHALDKKVELLAV
jgi:thymidylate synthase